MIEFKEIDRENFWKVINLKVTKVQNDFVATNATSIAQSKVQPECIPYAVYYDETLIGFVMYCLNNKDNEYWIYRMMIDQKFQGKGYGKKTLEKLIQLIKEENLLKHKIYLDVDGNNKVAISLYKKLGFEFDGRIIENEHVMVLEY